jgi:hypothetical protein
MSRFSGKRWAGISAVCAAALALAPMMVTPASAKGPVIHHVSAGGPDACEATGGAHPGCDGNFSLVANLSADGTVSGQYIDRFAKSYGFHAVINCVSISGIDAWVSGVITEGTLPDGTDLTGWPVAARVRDNGTSANDLPDQISSSRIGDPRPCTRQLPYRLFDAPQGQVIVD